MLSIYFNVFINTFIYIKNSINIEKHPES